jgi:hypothetical protein
MNRNVIHRVEVEKTQHKIPEIGNVVFELSTIGSDSTLTLKLPDFEFSHILVTGEKAREKMNEIMGATTELHWIVADIAAESCLIPTNDLMKKTNKAEIVFARYMASWYLYNYCQYNFHGIGKIFGKDHSTILHGVKLINRGYEDEKFFQPHERNYMKRFLHLLEVNNLKVN